jgi:hypothetical protein
MRRLLPLFLLVSLPLAAQELFSRFSVTGAAATTAFETNVRIDPELAEGAGTLVSFERDLGLEDSRTLRRFGVQWMPLRRHELAATYVSAPRRGFAQIDRQITFRNEVYPVSATVTTQFDLESWTATYTYWARRTDRDGFGITIGVADLALDASVTAVTSAGTATVTERADTDVPVALAGVQGRWAFTNRIFGEASVSTLPRVTIEDFTGRALTASARIEYRPVRWLGVGAAYSYFRLDVDVAQADLAGTLDMTLRGPEGYVRVGF